MPAPPSPSARDIFPESVIGRANYFQFQRGETLSHSCVSSRCFVGCKAGTGQIEVFGISYNLEHGDFLVLPWQHEISYRASQADPFLLNCVHLIPSHSPKHAYWHAVAHSLSEWELKFSHQPPPSPARRRRGGRWGVKAIS